jgi:hypothetical protein
MADTRTRIEKLQAMAADDSSPHEAAIARERLATLGAPASPPPPRPPTRNAGAVPEPFGEAWNGPNPFGSSWSQTSTTTTTTGGWTIHMHIKDPFG